MKMHEDTRDLLILDGYAAGKTTWEISPLVDRAPKTIASRIEAIINADIAHDPQAKKYWNKK